MVETKTTFIFRMNSHQLLVVAPCRSMNSYLVVYLCILISKAVINTALKYVWQADPNRDEPWYNGKTESERQRHVVSFQLTSSKPDGTNSLSF